MKTRDKIESEWQTKGFSCDLWVDPPGQTWENYKHAVDELIYIMEGTLELEVSGKTQTLTAGQEAFIPKNSKHSVRNIGGSQARWLYGYKEGSL